ncbi:MAG: ATP-binding protein [Chromatiales bacterium]
MSTRQEQISRFAASFNLAALVSIIGCGLFAALYQNSLAAVADWLVITLFLSLVLFIAARLFKYSNPQTDIDLRVWTLLLTALVLLAGLLWGSLFGWLNEYLPAAQPWHALWIACLVVLMMAGLFRERRQAVVVLLLACYVPLLAYSLLFSPQNSMHVAVIAVAMLLLSLMVARRRRRPESVTVEEEETDSKLRQELDDLKIAFLAQDDAIMAETALREAVEEALRHANRAAEAANYSKTEFLATISHEIRTPLNGILPILEMLNSTSLNREQAQLVNTAFHSSRQLLRIINDILDFSKAEVGKLEIESIELNLHDLIYSIASLMEKAADARNIELKVNIAPDVPMQVRGDSLRLRQILTNLLSNALKFTDKGYIALEVSRRGERVKEVDLMFTVRDTGIGMSEKTSSRLFRSFTQADASTTRKHGGTGLGLVICKRLVELMGGKIGVRSHLGKGSIFWFVLPMRKSISEVPAMRQDLHSAKILLYRSSRKDHGEVGRLLQDARAEVELCTKLADVQQQLELSQAPGQHDFYDLLLIDVTGFEVQVVDQLKLIKQQISNPLTQIMLVNSLPHLLDDLLDAGANAVIDRPLNPEVFRRRLYRLLDVEFDHPDEDSQSSAFLDEQITDEQLDDDWMLEDLDTSGSSGEFHGRALLVEDNPINLAVAKRMLQLQGITVTTALDGVEALQALEKSSFDVVFMDCHMPNMDGFEATANIRKRELENGLPHQLVIAMTANAMRGDRERCIEASMDDYLAKPVNQQLLKNMLAKWLDHADQPDEASAEQIVEETPALPGQDVRDVLDREVLAELQDVMGVEFTQLIYSYLHNSASLLAQMRSIADADGLPEIIVPAHSLKSSSSNVGAHEVARLAKELEHAARQGEEVDLKQHVKQLVIAYDQAATALKSYL